jgi:cell division protein ZapA
LEDTLKIKVNIANRTYPLTIKREEEEKIRAAVKQINDAVRRFEERYAVQDKQDVLAMCALQMASQIEKMRSQNTEQAFEYEQFLKDMEEALDNAAAK